MNINLINIQCHKTKIGELMFGSFQDKLCLLDYKYRNMRNTVDRRIKIGLDADYIERSSNIIEKTRVQFDEYLNGERKVFDVPLMMIGTEFQKNVWGTLMQIPYGVTISYSQLAKNINNEKAVRAVASANGSNAMSIIIPCHRVIGNNGELAGYGGGLPVKKRLLNLEKMNRVKLSSTTSINNNKLQII